MRLHIVTLLLFSLSLFSCQEYSNPPYNDFEKSLRNLPIDKKGLVIPKDWEKMDSLSFLRFKETSVIHLIKSDTIPNWIDRFPKLVTFISMDNNIKFIPKSIFRLKKIECLWISSSKIKEIPTSIGNLKSLKILDLNNNLISKIPNEINELESIENINLHNNMIIEIPDKISNLKHLKQIDVSHNRISKLPKKIFTLPNLMEISIENNPINIKKIKAKFDSLEKQVNVH